MTQYAASLDLSRLADDFGRAARETPRVLDQMLAEAANQIYVSMVLMVPKRTGKLSRSIRIVSSPGRYVIGPTAFYAPFMEYGTGIRGEFPTAVYTIRPKNARVLAFRSGGKTVFAKQVRHPGVAPRPFVRPAAQAYLDTLGDRVGDVAVVMITRQAA